MTADLKPLVVSGVTYSACFADVEPVRVTPVGKGFRATLQPDTNHERQEWIDHMDEVAMDLAWDGEHSGVVEAIYKDIERNEVSGGKPVLVQ